MMGTTVLFAAEFGDYLMLVVGGVLFLGLLIFLAIFARYFNLWIQCKMSVIFDDGVASRSGDK